MAIKVLHILSSGELGGTERMVLRLASYKGDGGALDVQHELAVLLGDGGDVATEAQKLGIKFHGGGSVANVRKIITGTTSSQSWQVVHLYGLRADLAARGFAARRGIKVVSAIRSTDPWRRFHHTLLDRLTQRHVDLWISNSQAGKRVAIQRERIAPDQIVVIPNGVEPAPPVSAEQIASRRTGWAKQVGIDGEPMVIACVANLRWMKGYPDLAKAFDSIAREYPNALLLCLGKIQLGGHQEKKGRLDGEALAAAMKEIAAAGGWQGRLLLYGPHPNPPELLPACDLMTLASEHEGMPASLIEGMAAGLPLVATDVGGISEVVKAGENGYLVPPGAYQELGGAFREILNDPEKRKVMATKSKIIWKEQFSLSKMVTDLNIIYDRLAKD